jgi:ribonuclease R
MSKLKGATRPRSTPKSDVPTPSRAATRVPLIVGTVSAHPDGFGFLIPEDKSGDLFLSAQTMRNVLHGDTVSVRVLGLDNRGKREAEIVDVLARGISQTVGSLHLVDGTWFVVAKDQRIAQDIVIPKSALAGAKAGDIVSVAITRYPSADDEPKGKVIEVLGGIDDDGIEIEIALRQYDLPYVWPDDVVAAEEKLPNKVRPADLKNRQDLRALPLVTIDGETAKDFDDAVYAEKKRNGFRLIVAIADVSHYVKSGEPIDREAHNRSTSVYFPRRVIPMLPEALSNEMCSLKPHVDRLCMVCDMDVTVTGNVKSYTFYPAVMHSQARLTYTQVWNWLSEKEVPTDPTQSAVMPHLQTLYKVYQTLRKAREKRGAIDFESNETVIEFTEGGKIASVHPSERNEAHKLIEECMLAANVCSAEYLLAATAPALYRNHEGPTPEKLESLRTFLGRHAIPLGGGDKPKPKDYAALAALTASREDAPLIHMLILRSLQQARYAPDNLGHFGLAYEAYTHFTSPIRRYPDLVVHRAIKGVLSGKPPRLGDLVALGEHTSACERRADEASRAVLNYLKCMFMRDHVGEEFDGTISGVTGFGIFVTIDGMGIDGLVHISTLPTDYYKHDPIAQRLDGERQKRSFQISQKLRVRVARADPDALKIDFVLAESA